MISKKQRKPRKSFVCVPCKVKKLKCDKIRPTCTRCKTNSISCFHEDQHLPDISSPDHQPLTGPSPVHSHQSRLIPPSYREVTPADQTRRSVSSTSTGQNIGYFRNITVNLCNPKDSLVISGPKTFMESILGAITLVQLDPYCRILAGSIHGVTITEMQNQLKRQSFQLVPNKRTPNYDVQKELGCLAFIEKAIVKYMEVINLKDQDLPWMQLFSGSQNFCEFKSPVHSRLARAIVSEIEILLLDVKDIDLLLRVFREFIYPFYPFMDIEIFQSDLRTIFSKSQEDSYELDVKKLNTVQNLETLGIFLVILILSSKALTLRDIVSLRRKNELELMKQLKSSSIKLLCLLNDAVSTNESVFCCLLYLYTGEYLDPESLFVIPSSNSLLELRNLQNIAMILGLQHRPSQLSRISRNKRGGQKIVNLRWRLWVGFQCLKLQVATPEGAIDKLDYEYMQAFLGEDEESPGSFHEGTNFTNEFDVHLNKLMRRKYSFQKTIALLISDCSPIIGKAKLQTIIDDIKRSKELLLREFPIISLSIPLSSKQVDSRSLPRSGNPDIEAVEKSEILIANIVGYTCIMSIYRALALSFEKKCINEKEIFESFYHSCTLEGVKAYLTLIELISDYLSGKLSLKPTSMYGYAINKLISHSLIKIWIVQCSFLLRLEFKRTALESQELPSSDYGDKLGNLRLYRSLLISLRHQMNYTLDLATEVLQKSHFCTYEAIPMFRYIVYLVDVGRLVSVTNRFWEMISIEGVPDMIKNTIGLKWGLSIEDCEFVKAKLLNSQMLGAFNEKLLLDLESLFQNSKLSKLNPELYNQQFSLHEPDDNAYWNEFLESNLEQFMDILNASYEQQ